MPEAGYEIDFLAVSGLDRRNPLKAVAAVGRAAAAVPAARRVLRERGADVVLGGGGYVAGPVGLAAVRMGLPLVLTEADSHLGLANRLLARRARRVCLAFPIPGREGEPYLLTGRPVPRAVLEADPAAARRRFAIPEGDSCIAVVGGSIGALSVNQAAFAAFGGEEGGAEQAGRPWVLHVTGRRDYAELKRALGARRRAGALPAARVRALAGRRAGGRRPRRGPGGRLGDGGGGRRAARDPCSLSARDRRPPDRQRPLDGGRWRRDRDRRRRADPRAPAAPRRPRCWPTPSAWRGWRRPLGSWPARTRPSGSPPRCWPRRERADEPRPDDWKGRRLHFVAIGGAGMSGLALVCAELGAEVTGSDRSESSYIERLRAAGLEPAIGHDAAQVPEDAEVVVSTAIGEDNPELAVARERGQRVLHRGELLAELCRGRRLLAVSGTHGKTTTTAMLVHALRETGADPSFFLGGELPGAGPGGEAANAGWGEGEWVVAEADESDASFLELEPEVAVITNLELDHHSTWSSLAELTDAFARFAAPAEGLALAAEAELPAADGAATGS